MHISLEKLKAILRYFATNTNSAYLGKTKLMKLFYFLDFQHVKQFGTPVTWDRYVHLDYGPIPSTIKNFIDRVAEDPEHADLSDVIEISKQSDPGIQRITARSQFSDEDAEMFTKSELQVLGQVAARFRDSNAGTIVEASHNEAPWKRTIISQDIPYTLAAEDSDSAFTADELELTTAI